MELFLLLSMGMSLVCFISIAINHPSPIQQNENQLDPALSLDYLAATSSEGAFLQINNKKMPLILEVTTPTETPNNSKDLATISLAGSTF